jgi:hypothetical protein
MKKLIPAEIKDDGLKYNVDQFNERVLAHNIPGDIIPTTFEHSPEDVKKLRTLLDAVIPSTQRKLKSRFISYMKCDTISIIAKRANVTKQNTQKQFQRIIRAMQHKYGSEDHQERRAATPKQFKNIFNGI